MLLDILFLNLVNAMFVSLDIEWAPYILLVAPCIQTQIQPSAYFMGEFAQCTKWKHLCRISIILFMTLARFVIVNQKGGDCKSKMLLSFILVNPDTGARMWTNSISKCLHMFCPQ